MQMTLSAIVDEIEHIFTLHDFFPKVMRTIFENKIIEIPTQFIYPVAPHVDSDLDGIVEAAIYNYLLHNTAYGFADWAVRSGRLRWKIV